MPSQQNPRVVADDALEDFLPFHQRQRPEIPAVVHEAIERVEDRRASAPEQLVELRSAGRVQHHDLAVEDGITAQ